MSDNLAFVAGWNYGLRGGRLTARQALKLHPSYTYREIDAFLSGADDGSTADTFRLGLITNPPRAAIALATEPQTEKAPS